MTLKLEPGTVVHHMCADNDANGNPRRVFTALVNKGEPGIFYQMHWDEVYRGHHAVPEELREAAYQAIRQPCSVRYYKLCIEHPCVKHSV